MATEASMIGSIFWLLALLLLYVVGEAVTDLILPRLARPIGRRLRTQRSPWFLVLLWTLATLTMIGGWKVGSTGTHIGPAVALFVLAGAAAVAGTMNWFRAANELPQARESRS
jgi:hypothetical protein